MTLVNFTPWTALGGGLLIGASALLLMLFNGKIAGISGITKGLLSACPTPHERRWRLAFVIGLVLGGLAVVLLTPDVTAQVHRLPVLQMALGGLLVGVGTAMGNGCTSGHGVCGLGRRSPRSLASVMTFMATGMATLYLLNLTGIGRF
ncbi:MAG: YeeE/YedE family protein [Candidatus Sericytochromatia bacterium]